jgi:branched-chain amino acid transport system substrate-binding protein
MNEKKSGSSGVTRRDFLKVAGTGALAGCLTGVPGVLGPRGSGRALASVPDIKIAVVYPLSGALSRNGNLTLQGAKAAMQWVNDNGGIKSLGGAKLVPVVADSGSTVEGAANATARVCNDPDILMACGCWASSLTLAATEVTERIGIPHFSISSADELHQRGFKWGFYVSPPMSVYGDLGLSNVIELAQQSGGQTKTSMLVGDNGASSQTFYAAAKKYFSNNGVKILGEETWPTGGLTDASPVMQKIKSLNPDMVLFSSLAISETQMCMMKRKELGIKAPFLYSGGYGADPSFRQIGPEFLEGNICFAAFFPHKMMPKDWIDRSLAQCRKEYSDEPWVGQELGFTWTMVPIMAEALERAKSRKREAIREAASQLELENVMATRAIAKQGIAFDKTGRIDKKYQGIVVVQWQGGVPVTVYPPELALAKPTWLAK